MPLRIRVKKPRGSQTPPDDLPVVAYVTPQQDLESLGPVLRQNHIAYVPSKPFAGVPGVGTGNLAYAPNFLLSGPEFYGGNAILRHPNSIMIAQRPAVITRPKTTLEGIGGIVAGQIVHQPLLEIEVNNADSGVGSE